MITFRSISSQITMAKSILDTFTTFFISSLIFKCLALDFLSPAFALSPFNSGSPAIYLNDIPANSNTNHVNNTLEIPSKSVVQAQLKKRVPQDFLQVSIRVSFCGLVNGELSEVVLGEGTVHDRTPFKRTKRP